MTADSIGRSEAVRPNSALHIWLCARVAATGERPGQPTRKEVTGVNYRDAAFCTEYLVDFDAKNAALRAGFAPGTARNAAAWIHPEHPTKPNLRKEIDRLIAQRSIRTGITADRVLQEIARIAFADITDVVDTDTGGVRKDASRDDTAAIALVTVKKGKISEKGVRMHDKVHALELLGRHLGMLKEDISISGALPVIIDDSPAVLPEESDGADG